MTNPLKSCGDIKSFSEFLDNVGKDIKKNVHIYTYVDPTSHTKHSYTLNQIAYKFKECTKIEEAKLNADFPEPSDEKKALQATLHGDARECLEKIALLSALAKPNWKTPIKNTWFALTHKGFKAAKELQKIQKNTPVAHNTEANAAQPIAQDDAPQPTLEERRLKEVSEWAEEDAKAGKHLDQQLGIVGMRDDILALKSAVRKIVIRTHPDKIQNLSESEQEKLKETHASAQRLYSLISDEHYKLYNKEFKIHQKPVPLPPSKK